MKITVRVKGQQLKPFLELQHLVAGSQEFVQFVFDLDDDWEKIALLKNSIFAQFTQNEESYNVFLDDGNSVYLPPEIQSGKCTLMLYGTRGDTRAISDILILTIDRNHLVSDASSVEITQTLYDQMVRLVGGAVGGTPSVVTMASEMTNTERIYIYLGSETGYINGGWYYYEDEAWVFGGNYISSGVDIATTTDTMEYLGLS